MSIIISIILPCYNVEKYINKTVDSILNQKFKNFELIIINDGSTDNTGNILSDFYDNHPRIKLIHQKNKGVSKSRNEGLDLATGKYIIFIDGDDWIGPTFLSEYIRLLNIDDQALIYQGFVSEYYNKNVIEKLPERVFLEAEIAEAIIFLEEKKCLGGIWNKIFVRNIIVENNIRFDLRFSYGEDKIFTLQYLQNVNKIIFSNNTEYYYNRKAENSLSKKFHKSNELLSFVKEENNLFRKIEKKFPSILLQKIINARYSSFSKYVLLSMYRKTDNATQEMRDHLRKKIIEFDKSNKRNPSFEDEVPKIVSLLFTNDFLMRLLMRLKENFFNIYIKLR